MKILLLPKWYPHVDDVQHGIFIKNHALAISKYAQVGVLFVVTSEKISEDKIEIEKAGNYFSLTYYFPKKSNRLFALYSYYKSFVKAKDLFEKEWGKPTIALLYILGRNYRMYKKFYSDIPFVVSEQWSGYLNGGMEKYIYAKRRNTLIALKKAQSIIAVSETLATALKKYSKKNRVEVIPNIVLSVGVAEIFIKDEIKVLTVADLDDQIKNISGMIQALSKIESTLPICFTIIGEGKDEPFLKDLATKKSHSKLSFVFKKRMNHSELLKQYSNCHFYILNSRNETFCVAAAEAISAGRPVISTKCGGPEVYLTKDNSLLIESGDSKKLELAITQMLSKLEQNQWKANEIAKTIESKYGADAIAKQYLTILEGTINKKND